MMVGNWKEFYTGLLYGSIGIAALWIGRGYQNGSASAMGPGYLPNVLAGGLLAIALVCLVRSVVTRGAHIRRLPRPALLLVPGALLFFSVALMPLGLLLSTLAAYLVAFVASRHSRLNLPSLGIALGFAVFCTVLFKYGLAIPVPLLPSFL